jgi:predicted ArsR family transcriptional regulator
MSVVDGQSSEKPWRFVTSHGQVLLCIAHDPDTRLRDIAATVGITERAVQRIVADLVGAGFVGSERLGRRNRYEVNRDAPMRHPSQTGHAIGEFLDLFELENPVGANPAR